MNWIEYYQNLYHKFSQLTPLYFDCGQLCSKICCADNDKGMILFPHEESYIESLSLDYRIQENEGYHFLFCNGSCERDFRPLACIMFPLFPFLYEDGRLDLKLDTRGKNLCPLCSVDMEELRLQPLFRLRLFKLFTVMIKNEEISDYLKKLTLELIEIERFMF
ncbi:MAG: hypothetical protein JXQ23_02605 [Clostridia bacterium]|nr:hypothetical protein [Clostridia bacterium]